MNNSSLPESVILLGATGLVGGELLKLLAANPGIKEVHALVRRDFKPSFTENKAKLRVAIVEFAKLKGDETFLSAGIVACALGSTIKKAGSQEAFREIDYHLPLKIARFARAKGAKQFLLVSALGADPSSGIFYNRVKGELERDLAALHFERLIIARPSILLGERPEARPLEKIGQAAGKWLPKRWRSVPAALVAKGLFNALNRSGRGVEVMENSAFFG